MSEQWLALYFPLLGLDLLKASSAQVAASCLVTGTGKHQQVYRCNSQALRYGIEPGMPLSAALISCPSMAVYPHDPGAELIRLQHLAEYCLGYSSRVSISQPESLLLEVAGSQRLWQPEFLRHHLTRFFSKQPHVVYGTLHTTPTGALLMARNKQVCPLDKLPLDVFPADQQVIQKLSRIGVHRLQDYLALPEKDRIIRFGLELEQTVQKTLGRIPDPQPAFQPPVRFRRSLELEYETDDASQLLFYARRLLDELSSVLEQNCCTVQKLRWLFQHYRQPDTLHEQQLLHPGRDTSRISLLLREQLEHLPLAAPVEKISLQVNRFWPDSADSLNLLRDMGQSMASIEPLLEKLQARLGQQAIRQLCALPDHRPEKSWAYLAPGKQIKPPSSLPPRPLWLLPSPKRLVSIQHFQHWQGPERLAGGWWESDMQRDYYVACHRNGVKYWLYRHQHQWFMHGVFG